MPVFEFDREPTLRLCQWNKIIEYQDEVLKRYQLLYNILAIAAWLTVKRIRCVHTKGLRCIF